MRVCLVCNQFGRGVIAMLGAVTPDSFDTLHSYTNTFQMPFVTPWFPEKVIPPSSGLIDYAVSMRPDYHRAVIDTITYYGWKNVIYIYDSHDANVFSTIDDKPCLSPDTKIACCSFNFHYHNTSAILTLRVSKMVAIFTTNIDGLMTSKGSNILN
ncbi:unnamed protein product [Chilo suppressalis]|uniref:Receptor ligand binding region domain-containing protein n=1 Tax=Chilo suppressalis TaxID=168631 RepID=A0ABN8B807_CHISP|nr:unnamed protein product [Chilo suppressalis]